MGTHTHNFRAEAEHTMLEVYSIIIYVVQYGKSKDIINFSVSEIFASVFLLLLLLPLNDSFSTLFFFGGGLRILIRCYGIKLRSKI